MRLSHNQMAEWIHQDTTSLVAQDDLIDEYFSCMVDCEDNRCRQICTETFLK